MPKEIYPNYIPDVDLPEPDPNSPVSQFLYGPIDGRRIVKRSLTLSQLNFVPLESVGAKNEIVATINASNEGLKITSSLIKIDGSVEFSSGYNPTEKVDELGGSYASAQSGARVKIFPDPNTGLQIIDDADSDVFKAYVGGASVGDVILGDYASGKYVIWDKSAATLKLGPNALVDNRLASTLSSAINASGQATAILDGIVTELKLANQAVTNTKIAIDAIQGAVIAADAITETKIASDAVSSLKIQAGAIIAGKIATGAVTAAKIEAGAVISEKIYAGAVTADKISVSQLSAISADIGLVTAGTIRGVQIETAASGQRIILYSTLMAFYNSSNENVANIYAGADDLLIKNQLTSKNIFIDAGSGGYTALGTGGTIRFQVGASVNESRLGIAPYADNSYPLGLATKRWTNLYLAGALYLSTSPSLTVQGDLIPTTNNYYWLGDSTHKWNYVYRTNESACPLPTSNSAIDVFKKIKAPKIFEGEYGERHYFKEDDFPKEMKFMSPRGEKEEIEMTRTLGIAVQAIRELIEKVEKLEQKVEPK